MKTDMQLHTDVLAELAWDPRVNEKEIGVAVKDGVVTLTGSVANYADKWSSERAVERVADVRAVANDLKVNIPATASHSDTEIAHQVVEALAWDIRVPNDKIQSAVTNGWVTMTGSAEWGYQREAAERAVRNLVGVRGVTNSIKVTPRSTSASDVSVKIKTALERRADRTAEHINVETFDGIVTLKGSVPSFSERRAAEAAAWSAAGVREVRDELVVGV